MMMPRAFRWLTTALVVLAASAVPFLAPARPTTAPTEADKNRAAQLVYQGDDQRKAGDHEATLEAYQQADELMRVPSTGIEVARELAAVGRLVQARAKCAEVARYPERRNEPAAFGNARVDARQLAVEVELRQPVVRVRVRGSTTAVLLVDGQRVSASVNEPIRLDPGEHTIVARSGSETASETVTLSEAERREIVLVLQTEVAAATGDAAAEDESPGLSPWVWIGFGVGGAGLLTGTITGALALQTTSVLAEECDDDQVCPAKYEGDVDKGVVLSHVSTVGFAVGIAGVGVGVVALLLSFSDDDETASAIGIQPLAGPRFVGVRGAF